MNKFRVGDEVRAISESCAWGSVTKFDTGRVVYADISGKLEVDFPAQRMWACHEHNLELVEPRITAALCSGGSGGSGGVTYGGVPVAIHPNPPHKHKDLIIAWANGAEIEYWERITESWKLNKNPEWRDSGTYRIKPTKTPLEIEIEELEAKLAKLKMQQLAINSIKR